LRDTAGHFSPSTVSCLDAFPVQEDDSFNITTFVLFFFNSGAGVSGQVESLLKCKSLSYSTDTPISPPRASFFFISPSSYIAAFPSAGKSPFALFLIFGRCSFLPLPRISGDYFFQFLAHGDQRHAFAFSFSLQRVLSPQPQYRYDKKSFNFFSAEIHHSIFRRPPLLQGLGAVNTVFFSLQSYIFIHCPRSFWLTGTLRAFFRDRSVRAWFRASSVSSLDFLA